MNPEETNREIKPDIGIQAWYKKTGDSIFINSPCVFTDGSKLKLLWVYLKGFKFHIVGVDIRTGDLVMKNQRLNANELACSFLICDLLYFDEDLVRKILRTFEEEDLLEFDFEGKE